MSRIRVGRVRIYMHKDQDQYGAEHPYLVDEYDVGDGLWGEQDKQDILSKLEKRNV